MIIPFHYRCRFTVVNRISICICQCKLICRIFCGIELIPSWRIVLLADCYRLELHGLCSLVFGYRLCVDIHWLNRCDCYRHGLRILCLLVCVCRLIWQRTDQFIAFVQNDFFPVACLVHYRGCLTITINSLYGKIQFQILVVIVSADEISVVLCREIAELSDLIFAERDWVRSQRLCLGYGKLYADFCLLDTVISDGEYLLTIQLLINDVAIRCFILTEIWAAIQLDPQIFSLAGVCDFDTIITLLKWFQFKVYLFACAKRYVFGFRLLLARFQHNRFDFLYCDCKRYGSAAFVCYRVIAGCSYAKWITLIEAAANLWCTIINLQYKLCIRLVYTKAVIACLQCTISHCHRRACIDCDCIVTQLQRCVFCDVQTAWHTLFRTGWCYL